MYVYMHVNVCADSVQLVDVGTRSTTLHFNPPQAEALMAQLDMRTKLRQFRHAPVVCPQYWR